ncbi:MAG TPA: OmpA family protein, partial [Stellaceae bacterium]
NWELSSDRANASRRALVQGGLPAERVARVVGMADREPLIADQPASPRNRRISIVLLREQKPAGRTVQAAAADDGAAARR